MPYRTEEAFHYLETARRRNRLAHAFLVTADAIGQAEDLVLRCVRLLTGAEAERIGDLKHPAVQVVKPESVSRIIRVEQIRNLERFVHLASGSDCKVKIVVIHEADRLGESSENALLKTLEEPPAGVHLFLTSSQPDRLLPTVRSRCVRVDLYGPENAGTGGENLESRAFLEGIGSYLAAPERSVSAALHQALRLSAALGGVKGAIEKRNAVLLKGETESYAQTTDGSWLKEREEYYKGLTRADYLRERNLVVTALLSFVGDAIRHKAGAVAEADPAARKLAEAEDLDVLLTRYGEIDLMRAQLESTANENLVLEAGFIRAFS